MIKEVNIEVPAVEAHVKKDNKYYCDSCGKEILYPGSLCTSTVSYCLLDDTKTNFREQAENMYYFHLCNECIRKYIVPYLQELGYKPYRCKDIMSKEEYDSIVVKE